MKICIVLFKIQSQTHHDYHSSIRLHLFDSIYSLGLPLVPAEKYTTQHPVKAKQHTFYDSHKLFTRHAYFAQHSLFIPIVHILHSLR